MNFLAALLLVAVEKDAERCFWCGPSQAPAAAASCGVAAAEQLQRLMQAPTCSTTSGP
jgi:hypothetical protein